MKPWRERTAVALIFVVALGFIALRILGHSYFSNNWSFLHWQNQPWWYSVAWSAVFVAAIVFAFLKSKQIADFFSTRLRRIAGLLVIIILLILCQFDSFLFANGNNRVAQIAQTDYIIHRWFEYGSSLLVTGFYELFELFGMAKETAAVFAWSTLLWISTLLSLWGSVVLTGEFTKRTEIRFWLFLIIFFGPQTLAYMGLLGPNVTIIPVVIWLTIFAFRSMKNRSLSSLVMVWLVTIIGVLSNHLAALLVPAAIYVTLRSALQLKRWSIVTIVSTFVSLVLAVAAFYILGWKNLEFSHYILFFKGKNPFVDYGIFSGRHIGDIVQMLLLVFPQLVVVFFLFMSERRQAGNFFLNGLSWLLFLIGMTTLFIVDPLNSIVLDLPKLVVLLTSAGIVAACVVRLSFDRTESSPRLPALMAVMAVFLPLSIAPIYSRISIAEPYVTAYLDENPAYYIRDGLAMRDSYFYKKDYDKANEWESLLVVKSGDYLGFKGAQNLQLGGDYDGAAEEYYRLKNKYPFWTQPRAQLASIQLNLNQLELARAEMDTLLMLEPYNKIYHQQLIGYFIKSRNFISALEASNKSLEIFQDDKELMVNKMTALFHNGKTFEADSLARDLIRIDSTLPYPYLFRALILDKGGNNVLATRNYELFLSLKPDSPEAPEVRKRLNALTLEIRQRSENTEEN